MPDQDTTAVTKELTLEVANIPVRKAVDDLLRAYNEAAYWENYYQTHELTRDTRHHIEWRARRDACSKAYYALEALG